MCGNLLLKLVHPDLIFKLWIYLECQPDDMELMPAMPQTSQIGVDDSILCCLEVIALVPTCTIRNCWSWQPYVSWIAHLCNCEMNSG